MHETLARVAGSALPLPPTLAQGPFLEGLCAWGLLGGLMVFCCAWFMGLPERQQRLEALVVFLAWPIVPLLLALRLALSPWARLHHRRHGQAAA
ncbi:hypothetical protein E3E12_07755 [Formicincola oecophyllae]|uniref:Uncharacterized protein n=1 Tax=Formicincola oecophyllae TaxID=2558361 RepID=A0A4Y6UAW6_9PROT|nr:hypothetical protein [Formicincola oecophyllae]QDH14090.1 hypothetical protein E3E12_07755 [Formicincola oecophyllae]